jgi:excisionase family DNA binding protein
MLTVADIAGHLGANEQTVRLWIRTGELKASKHGSRIGYRIKHSDYDAFLARRTIAATVESQLLRTATDNLVCSAIAAASKSQRAKP